MANRSILKVPDTRLRNKSTAVQSFGKDLLLLVQDLIDTTNANQGAGVAAPQIGVHKRVAVLKCSVFECGNPDPFDENENSDFWVLVNPELELSEEVEQWEEGCLSVPWETEVVERASRVSLKWFNVHGESRELQIGWPLSGAVQHECDHLDGKVFLDRISRLKRSRILKRIKKKQAKLDEIRSQFEQEHAELTATATTSSKDTKGRRRRVRKTRSKRR